MTDNPSRRLCLLVQLEQSADRARIASAATAIKALLQRWSKGEFEMLCAASDGRLFGFLLSSNLPAEMIRAEFEKSGETRNSDSMIVFEIGDEFTGIGFSRAWTWLQRH